MEFIKFINDIVKLYESLKDTPGKILLPLVAVFCVGYSFIKWVAIPIWKGFCWVITWKQKRKFVIHESLSYMKSGDVYYLIDHFIPTRYSMQDPARNDEPIPEYYGEEVKRKPLLIDHFLKYEFDQKHGDKFYLVLADCGMGKTTFLINLFYTTQRKLNKDHPCAFVSLVRDDCIDKIKAITDKERTILLLDALDENDLANRDFQKFISDLEEEVQDFYRVVITSRTHFFTNSEKEQFFIGKNANSTMGKITNVRKYYIAPFTDDDIRRYLHKQFKGKKYKQAWKVIEANKNLTVRPLILRFMDDFIQDNILFAYKFELYEYLFRKWIIREVGEDPKKQESLYQECLIIAKAMYYQWMKNGRVGIYPSEIDEKRDIPGLSRIRFKAHAMLNRTSEGMYKFAHHSYWEYLIARLALLDLPFSDDLFIHNFDQAEAFLKEMRDCNESHLKEQDRPVATTELLGIANYYLKYWKPEEAERLLKVVLEREELLSLEEVLFAKIHLARCYRYEMKEKSAENILLSLYDILFEMNLTEELVPYYSQFGIELSVYSNHRKIKKGELFLREVIAWCKENEIIGYELFKCYESLSYCAINYANHENAVFEMMLLNDESSKNESNEYIDFLITSASIWKSSYYDIESYYKQVGIHNNYGRFLDDYNMIVLKSMIGASLSAINNAGNSKKLSDIPDSTDLIDVAIEYLGDAELVVERLYADVDIHILNNPYIAFLYYRTLPYFEVMIDQIPYIMVCETVEKLLAYRKNAGLEEEMQITYCKLLTLLGNDKSKSFEECIDFLQKAYDWAVKINCPSSMVSILWKMYIVYDRNNIVVKGQEKLKNAYELACAFTDYAETPSYCTLLQVMIDYYYGDDIEKNLLYEDLKNRALKVYGDDKRRARIFRCLRDYAEIVEDNKALQYAMEVLRCGIIENDLERGYRVFLKFSNESFFIKELEKILEEMPMITNECMNEINSFCKQAIKESEDRNDNGTSIGIEKEIMDMAEKCQKEKAKIRFKHLHLNY